MAAYRAGRLAALAAAIAALLVFTNTTAASAAVAGLGWTPALSTDRPVDCIDGGDTCRSGMSIANASLMQVNSTQFKVPTRGLDQLQEAVVAQSEGKAHEAGGSGSNVASTMPSKSSTSMGGGTVVGVSANMPPSAYPKEPLLDEDYIHDANNSLEKFTEKGQRDTRTTQEDSNQDLDSMSDPAADANANGSDESPICVTKADPRAVAAGYMTAAPGTPCIFGVDVRDEGWHCVVDPEYGSFGWCFTDNVRRSFGSCSEDCPMSGPRGVLQRKIDAMDKAVSELLDKMKDKAKCGEEKGGGEKGGDDKKKKKKKDKAKSKTKKE